MKLPISILGGSIPLIAALIHFGPVLRAAEPEIAIIAIKSIPDGAEAQYQLASNLARGENGVAKDEMQAALLYRKAAEQGHLQAQNNLATAYLEGKGVKQDEKEAASWYRKAAEQGAVLAQNNLGLLLSRSVVLPRSPKEAESWFKKAAEQNYSDAQFNLGNLYFYGADGLEKDYHEAVKWLQLAAEQNHRAAKNLLAVAYQRGLGVPRDLKKALEYFQQAAEAGDVRAQRTMGGFFTTGAPGLERSPAKAWLWLTLSADQGHLPARKEREELERGIFTPEQILEGRRLVAEYRLAHEKK